MGVCVCLCVGSSVASRWKTIGVCVFVCVCVGSSVVLKCERGREREREGECVCVRAHLCL